MIARIISAGQHHYYDNVIDAWSDGNTAGEYFHLKLDAHPSLVHFWRPYYPEGFSRSSVLLAADGEAFTAALREEMGEYHLHLSSDEIAEMKGGIADDVCHCRAGYTNPTCFFHNQGQRRERTYDAKTAFDAPRGTAPTD